MGLLSGSSAPVSNGRGDDWVNGADTGNTADAGLKSVEENLSVDTAEELDVYPAKGTPLGNVENTSLVNRLFWEGGTPADAFLTAASAQVGQVILNLPNSMAKLGLAAGVCTQVICATAAVYTLWLLASLYHEFKRTALKTGTWFNKGNVRDTVTQYHSVITHTTGSRVLGEFSRFVNVVELLGLAVAQIIASASNFYSLGTGLDKRTFTFIFSGISFLIILIPSFRNMRLFAFLALVGTTYTSWYMMIVSWVHGLNTDAASWPPGNIEQVFAATSNILFTFGGHCMLLEVLDSQFRPSKFAKTFMFALLYVTCTLTVPNASFVYLAFPEQALQYGNAFAIFPNGAAKNVGIVLMVAHQLVAYGLFILPVCIMVEKLTRTHWKSLGWKYVARTPVWAFVSFIAVMLPFFGVINDLLGAFAVSFETYIIPCLAFNIYFWRAERRAKAVVKPLKWAPWNFLFAINYIIIIGAAVVGLGFGGYASVTALIDSIGDFGLFAACYNC